MKPSSGTLSVREKALGIARGFPEVVIKVESPVRKGVKTQLKGFRKLVDAARYISRDGTIALENQDGMMLQGKDEILRELEGWRDLSDIPPDETGPRAATRMVLSLRGAFDRKAFRSACRAWARDVLGEYDWVMCAHEDTATPHVHLILRSRNLYTGLSFGCGLTEFQRMREKFVLHLRSFGIEANATTRRARGEGPVRRSQGTIYAMRRGETPKSRQKAEDDARRFVTDVLHGKPLPQSEVLTKARAAQAEVKRQAFAYARSLLATGNEEDARLARDFARHYENLPVMESLSERTLRFILEEAKERQNPQPERPLPKKPPERSR